MISEEKNKLNLLYHESIQKKNNGFDSMLIQSRMHEIFITIRQRRKTENAMHSANASASLKRPLFTSPRQKKSISASLWQH